MAILLVSNQPLASRLAGIPVHFIGGEETWNRLTACYNHPEGQKQQARETQEEIAATVFHL